MLPLPSRGGFGFVRSDRGDALSACAVRCRLFSFRDRRQNALEPVRLAASNAFQFARQLCGANNAAMSTAWARDRDQRHVFTPLHMIASVRLKRRARIYSRSELSRMRRRASSATQRRPRIGPTPGSALACSRSGRSASDQSLDCR